MENKIVSELQKHIEAKLEAEGIAFNDYDNAIKVLNNCVQGTKIFIKYKELCGIE